MIWAQEDSKILTFLTDYASLSGSHLRTCVTGSISALAVMSTAVQNAKAGDVSITKVEVVKPPKVRVALAHHLLVFLCDRANCLCTRRAGASRCQAGGGCCGGSCGYLRYLPPGCVLRRLCSMSGA